MRSLISSTASIVLLNKVQGLVLNNGVGKLPALGWNSWNAFGCDINSTKIMTAANEMVSLGLKDVGYEYVNIDDCWSVQSGRDNVTGQIIPDPNKFPDGINGIANFAHALGLKLGIYSSGGTETCAGYPASIGKEYLDASTFASWGVDYLKYDNCNVPSNWTDKYEGCVPDSNDFGSNLPGPYINGSCNASSYAAPLEYNWGTSNTSMRYAIMRDALLAQNRTILYSLCEWGQADVWTWGNVTGNSWRMSGDITPYWQRIAEIMNENSFLLDSVNFWGHNDPDGLEIGNGDLTLAESRSHFAFWAAMKSPLIISTALDVLAAELVDILKNKYLLAFSQDEVYGGPAMPYKWGTNSDWTFNATNPAEYWSGQSTNGTLVLALNTLDVNASREINWAEIPLLNGNDAYEVTDVWSDESLGCVQQGISTIVETHDTVAYMVGEPCSV